MNLLVASSLDRRLGVRDQDWLQKLCCPVKSAHGEGKAHQGEHAEGRPFEQHDFRRASGQQAKAQQIDLPGHRIDSRYRLKPSG
jgi:hypothetical protein